MSTGEHALMRETEYLNKLYNTADGIFITDANKRIISWNQGAERILGYPKTEVLNRSCFQVISGKHLSDGAHCSPDCKIHGTGLNGTPQGNFDLSTNTSEGMPVWLNVSVLSNADAEKSFIVHILRDVTKEIKLAFALNQFLTELESSDLESRNVSGKTLNGRHPAGFKFTPSDLPSVSLSARELEVLTLLAEGLSTKSLAQKLDISHFTARNHIQNILVKLDLHSKAQAVSYAYKKGIL
jgi:PAS domain S-box-containing protein